jgi:5-methylphenazine-1-carboxylate 1-monooxygenase
MRVIIVGGGIGGLTAALSLHHVGIGVQVFEQARKITELGVGINLLPHAVKELASLGLLAELDRVGIRTRKLIYANRFGQAVWREPRGTSAGHDLPQFSIHRGRLHGVLLRAVLERLGTECLHTGCRLVDFEERGDGIVARMERRADGRLFDVAGDALIGCDGIHSTLRRILYPDEGPPTWSGIML